HPVQRAAAGDVTVGQLCVGLVRDLGTATEGLDVGADLLRLLARVERRAPLVLRALPRGRHPAGGDLELDGRRASTHQARALVRDTLAVAAMAGDAARVEHGLACGDVVRRRSRVGGGPRARCDRGVEPADEEQGEDHPYAVASPATPTAAG